LIGSAHFAKKGDPKHGLPRPFGERAGVRGLAGHRGASRALTPTLSQRERGLTEVCRAAANPSGDAKRAVWLLLVPVLSAELGIGLAEREKKLFEFRTK